MDFDWKDIGERVAWTATQAFLAVVVTAGLDWVSVSTFKAGGVAAGAAVFSFLKNVATQKRRAMRAAA